MVDLEALPAVFVLRDGQVTHHFPPSILFAHASASSPLFPRHLVRGLHRVGAILTPEGCSSDEGGSASD
jgi:hypothetical protein